MLARSVIAAIIFIRPSHAGHFSASTPHTRQSRRAHSMRELAVDALPPLSLLASTCGRLAFTPSDGVADAATQGLHSSTGGSGTTAALHGEFGASTPW